MMPPKIIFIIPFRDRDIEKTRFSIYINYLLEDYNKNDYEIYYSHQCDSREFNRGAVKNIGFLVIKEKYPNDYKDMVFVFNDIDCIPNIKNNINYDTSLNNINHIYGFDFTLGGIFSIKGIDFEKCNGFPNNWGWGLEDNVFNNRVINNGLKINREKLNSITSKNIMHFAETKYKKVNNNDIKNYINNFLHDDLKTIKNLNYEIIRNNENVNFELNNQYIININNFDTLYSYNKKDFFYKDISTSTKLEINTKKINTRWNMNKLYIK
jgi:hypothetical protein